MSKTRKLTRKTPQSIKGAISNGLIEVCEIDDNELETISERVKEHVIDFIKNRLATAYVRADNREQEDLLDYVRSLIGV